MASHRFKNSWLPTPLPEFDKGSYVSPPRIGPPATSVGRGFFIAKFIVLAALHELLRSLFWKLGVKKERSVKDAHKARLFAERLGGMWVILARLISLRSDLLGREFCLELMLTRDRAVPLPVDKVCQIVDEELHPVGHSLDTLFESFDEKPLAARSFFQVHYARLKQSNREVSVRVRTPDAVRRAESDWRWMRLILFIVRQLNIEPHLRWDDLMFEVKKSTDDLLDFRTELSELRRIRKILRPRKIYVPGIYGKLCTERLLVNEHIKGVSLRDLWLLSLGHREEAAAWLQENKIDRRRLWRRIFNAQQELLFEHNFFYTELLPQNIIMLKSNRLAYVSLGTIGTLDAELLRQYGQLHQAILDYDYTKACDIYLAMGPALPWKDVTNARQEILRSLRSWESRTHIRNCPYSKKSLTEAMAQLARCVSEQELPAFWNLARLHLAERHLETTFEELDPTKNSLKAFNRYRRIAQARMLKQAASRRKGGRASTLIDTVRSAQQLLENFEHEGSYLRRRLISAQGTFGRVSQIFGRLFVLGAQLTTVALVLQLFLYLKHHHNISLLLPPGNSLLSVMNGLRPESPAMWVALIIFLLYVSRFLLQLARKLFSQKLRPSDIF